MTALVKKVGHFSRTPLDPQIRKSANTQSPQGPLVDASFMVLATRSYAELDADLLSQSTGRLSRKHKFL